MTSVYVLFATSAVILAMILCLVVEVLSSGVVTKSAFFFMSLMAVGFTFIANWTAYEHMKTVNNITQVIEELETYVNDPRGLEADFRKAVDREQANAIVERR